jgi:hypothetical protein
MGNALIAADQRHSHSIGLDRGLRDTVATSDGDKLAAANINATPNAASP